ncbi:MAG: acyltransferase family protein [Micrococcales bacterium]|nr:acyltransferase family protein [Micrococcales bacterium]
MPKTNQAPTHDRLFDAVRAFALLAVIYGHWMSGSVAISQSNGQPVLIQASPLPHFDWAAPITWLVAVLGWFFLVGGRLSAESWLRASSQQTSPLRSWWKWFRRRLSRLAKPLVIAIGPIAGLTALLWALGVPKQTLITCGFTLIQPLWFLAAYMVMTAATPILVALDKRCGWSAPLAMVLATGLIDLWRFGPFDAPSWIGWLNLIPGWAVTYQLGIAWAAGRIARRQSLALLVGGAAATLVCWLWLGYPYLMLAGGAEVDRANIHPPTLVMATLMLTAVGALLSSEPMLRRRPKLAGRQPSRLLDQAGHLSASGVSVLALHQVAALLPALIVVLINPSWSVLGLTAEPSTLGWIVARLAWLPVFSGLLYGIVRLMNLGDKKRPTAA